MKKLVLECHGSENVGAAVLHIDKTLAATLINRMALAGALKAGNPDFYALTYHDRTPDFFEDFEAAEGAATPIIRLEVCTMYVSKDEAYWVAREKHTCNDFETRCIHKSELLEIVNS